MEHLLRFITTPTVVIFDNLADAYDWLQRCPGRPVATSRA